MRIKNWGDRPWRAISAQVLAQPLAVPSMLSREESKLYHWLGTVAEGCGAVIDLGAFAGGSAARLLSGLALGASTARLYAYDRFTAGPRERAAFLYPAGVPETEDNDILPLATSYLSPWQDRVTLVRGDIAVLEWPKAPVEILAMDAGKSPILTDRVAEQFFANLIPGRSVVVHQDFLHKTQPWLVSQMLGLSGFFKPVAHVGPDCVVFVCTRKVTKKGIMAARTAGKSDDAFVADLEAAAELFAAVVPKQRILAMIPKLRANPGVRVAWKMRN